MALKEETGFSGLQDSVDLRDTRRLKRELELAILSKPGGIQLIVAMVFTRIFHSLIIHRAVR
jgi:hypothetical protein